MNVEIKKLAKQFDDELILQNINIKLSSGSKVALVGPNGSGKSTLIRCLMGMLSYDGEIRIEKSKDNALTESEIKQSTSYVPQISPYFSSLVSDITTTVLELRRVHFAHFDKHLNQLDLNYSEIKSRHFNKLSGGMKQKLLIALAFSANPSLLLLDEPTASLDPSTRNKFYQLCKDLNQVTLILCSHRLDEIYHLVDEVLVLDKGQLTYRGDAKEYLHRVLK